MCRRVGCIVAAWACVAALGQCAAAFSTLPNNPRRCSAQPASALDPMLALHRASGRIQLYADREADVMEQMVGGERFEMSALPDSMIATTLFVGNLCEFVKDEDLSELFRSVSKLQYVPACVVRKPDMTSRQYGFVSFPTVEEKEAALLRFQNYEFRGRTLKVEPIRDHPSAGRVKLPERMIAYVSGSRKSEPRSTTKMANSLRRISRDDVERLSRGQPAKRRGYGSRSVPHRLNDEERAELRRAQRKGYISLLGGGGSHRRERKGSPLANIFRQWCDARAKPQITLFKYTAQRFARASSRSSLSSTPMDKVVVDLSPLRLHGSNADLLEVSLAMDQYEAAICTAAQNAGMEIREPASDEEDDEAWSEEESEEVGDALSMDTMSLQQQDAWANKPIWQLPPLKSVEYWGERSHAKAMAKELASLWEVPEMERDHRGGGAKSRRSAGAKRGGKTKMRGLSQHRKRGGGHRQSWF